jgi:hypothetical protein
MVLVEVQLSPFKKISNNPIFCQRWLSYLEIINVSFQMAKTLDLNGQKIKKFKFKELKNIKF